MAIINRILFHNKNFYEQIYIFFISIVPEFVLISSPFCHSTYWNYTFGGIAIVYIYK